jgi:alkylation response protein AidB-like acyl-CoA dehydrogenase
MSELNEQAVREEVRAWLDENWDPNANLGEWRTKLADAGWGMPDWPVEWYGKDYPPLMAAAVDEEFIKFGAVGVAKAGIRLLAGATLLEHGNEDQKAQFLRRILTGEDTWCQLFSEPGSGSDLAGSTTRADRDGDQWKINGQKVWTTSAHHADWGLLLARTDWEVPKHQGLSYFVINMHQEGVVVKPLRQMNHHASFNEVFMTDAIVQPEHQLAELGQGWQVAMTTLAHERRRADGMRPTISAKDVVIEKIGSIYEEERTESKTLMAPYTWYPQRAGRVDLALPRAIETGKIHDPAVVQELAKLFIMSQSAEWTARRARAAQQQGKPQGPEGSLGKLAASHIARAAARVHTLISGADSMLMADGPRDGLIAEILISVPAVSIAGGTDEIQRNIISERVLDMPKEGRSDTGPFKDVLKN